MGRSAETNVRQPCAATVQDRSTGYDRVANLAARALDVSVACVAMARGGSVHAVACVCPGPRPPAWCDTICAAAVETGEPVWPGGAAATPCAADGGLRAAVPVVTRDGEAVGALCIGGDRARKLDARERAVLGDLAQLAGDECERRRSQDLAATETETLKWSERHFRELLDNAPVFVWMTDAAMRCTFCNRNWLQFTGLTLDEAMAGGIWNGLHPDDAARGKAAFVAAHEAPRSYSIEYRQRHHDGDYRWLLETGCPLRDDSGAFAGLVGSAVDITDLKHAEARLETRTRELELSNRALDQFAAVAAHDLRTPLRHVLQFAELLREEYRERLGSDASDYADNIVMAVHRMRGIVSSLLELARIPVSAAHDGFAAFALHDAVAMAHANVGKDALELTCDETLPQVCGAQGLITQLLQNLFDNAVKYHGAGQPHAHVSAWHESGMLLVAVTDDGVGMAHQHGEMTVSSVAPGNGIGLPLCRRIAELHGGDVWIDADHTPGTRVCFSVKAA